MKRYLPIAIGVLLFLLIFRLWKISLADTMAMLRSADWRLLLLALLAYVVMVYLKGIRWSYLLKMQGLSYPVWDCFLIYMATLYLGNLTPGRAGDFAKVFYLKQDLKVSAGRGITSVLVDRVFDLYTFCWFSGCIGHPDEPDAERPHVPQNDTGREGLLRTPGRHHPAGFQ